MAPKFLFHGILQGIIGKWPWSFSYYSFVKFSLSVLCLDQDFWGTPVSPYLNFRGTFVNSGGHTNSICFWPVYWKQFPGNFCSFLFTFKLDVKSFGSRRGCKLQWSCFYIAVVLNSPANILFLHKNSFFWPFSRVKFAFSPIVGVLDWLKNQYPMQQLSSINYQIHVHSLNYFPLIGFS